MWINADEMRDKVGSTPSVILQPQVSRLHAYFHLRLQHERNPVVGGEQTPRPTADEAHEKADEYFQAFKFEISQHKDEKAVLHNVASFSQLESICLEPSEEGSASFVRTPAGKLECQDTFYLSLGIECSVTEDKTKDKARHELLSWYFQSGSE